MEGLTQEISRSKEEADIADQQVGQMWIMGGGDYFSYPPIYLHHPGSPRMRKIICTSGSTEKYVH